jgi:hypothetical protein
MKKIKVFFVSLILVLGLASAMIITTQLYTKERVSQLGQGLGYWAFENGSIDLGDILMYNHSQIYEDFINPETGENTWRNLLAANPTLAYEAFDLYSTDFFEGFEEGFEENKRQTLGWMDENSNKHSEYDFEVVRNKNYEDYLRLNLGNMRKYQNLIDDLLKLDDSELNSLINSISKDPIAFEYGTEGEPVEAKELKKWLVMNGYINSVDQMNNTMMPYYSMFPTDVILLTRRISRSYPDWTNRKTLEEMKKFSVHVQNNLPVD